EKLLIKMCDGFKEILRGQVVANRRRRLSARLGQGASLQRKYTDNHLIPSKLVFHRSLRTWRYVEIFEKFRERVNRHSWREQSAPVPISEKVIAACSPVLPAAAGTIPYLACKIVVDSREESGSLSRRNLSTIFAAVKCISKNSRELRPDGSEAFNNLPSKVSPQLLGDALLCLLCADCFPLAGGSAAARKDGKFV